ncbi:uncharacterized protein LAESUDRAFT_816146 [Laetiporus sulphureus 93-53]|uniref:Uncharacterized protein n=1 Tax=Laetiporus sulphureus 93-53 TaxID=1314785 RepID=A0A165BHH0_9APHY|nr:uncharacterized protein LAESUDRAFT_816146 [Laetiporus sulphureus 93-53]KZT01064.1 hypothetical protein LAESUDRAFT_816146 [Laetiporus sulphureus 93-53]
MSDITSIDGTPATVAQSTDGPPLILVFLASGLFIGAVLSIVVLRRVYPSMSFMNPTRRVIPIERPLVEKPRLWDMCAGLELRHDGVGDSQKKNRGDIGGRWQTILPLSARFLPRASDYASGPALPHRSRRLLFERRSPAVRAEKLPAGRVPDDLQIGKLQIAVLIAMPSSHGTRWHCAEKRPCSGSLFVDEAREYCIGVAEISAAARPDDAHGG